MLPIVLFCYRYIHVGEGPHPPFVSPPLPPSFVPFPPFLFIFSFFSTGLFSPSFSTHKKFTERKYICASTLGFGLKQNFVILGLILVAQRKGRAQPHKYPSLDLIPPSYLSILFYPSCYQNHPRQAN